MTLHNTNNLFVNVKSYNKLFFTIFFKILNHFLNQKLLNYIFNVPIISNI